MREFIVRWTADGYCVVLKEITENDLWFSDNPDVVEVDELI